jgi:RimJ/RimL family protein N-acetyltransferase
LSDLHVAPRLETDRLILRAWRAADVDPFAAMMAEADVARFLSADQRPMDRAMAWRTMAVFVGHWALRGYGLFVVEEKSSGAFVGRIGAWRPEGWVGLELGWSLARAFWGRGYAYEAACVARDWMRSTLAPERIVSLIHVDNQRSQALARRLGMAPGAETYHAGMPHVIWSLAP